MGICMLYSYVVMSVMLLIFGLSFRVYFFKPQSTKTTMVRFLNLTLILVTIAKAGATTMAGASPVSNLKAAQGKIFWAI